MRLNDYGWIHDLLQEIIQVSAEPARAAMLEAYRRMHTAETDRLILQDADTLSELLLRLKSSSSALNDRLMSLSETERAELRETERIIDENLFEYYFQPIVNARNGEIYSYEALMRPKGNIVLSPVKILKYAALVNRLTDIERRTFLNVLGIIDAQKEKFSGKLVFINSIPEAKLSGEDFRNVCRMLMKHADTVVIEMTEQSEVDEEGLEALKERCRNMGIRLAIDDYGSGYSNIGNLLRYMPNYVKIDRSLLSEIQNSPKKRHFVREIIRFCHENEILALAEGIETAEELHTVIILGADLIQGFYTAKPSPEIIQSIPQEIRQMMKRCYQECESGKEQQIYTADSFEQIPLEQLTQSGMNCIVIGAYGSGNVTVSGMQNVDTQIHIETKKGFKGTVTLENVWLSNAVSKPCIDIGEESDVTLILNGENKLYMGGIRVPESARLTVKGEGKLYIELNADGYYGIGNGIGLKHGEMVFDQSGRITVNAQGMAGVAIGSGSGGEIQVLQGQYRFNLDGIVGLGFGSLYTDSNLLIHDCDIGMNLHLARGCAIGSIGGSSDLLIYKVSLKLFLDGTELVGIGTVGGVRSKLHIHDASCIMTVKGERCAAIASLEGASDVTVEKAAVRITCSGEQALGIGGFTGETLLHHDSADSVIVLETPFAVGDYLTAAQFSLFTGRFVMQHNGKEILSNA